MTEEIKVTEDVTINEENPIENKDKHEEVDE